LQLHFLSKEDASRLEFFVSVTQMICWKIVSNPFLFRKTTEKQEISALLSCSEQQGVMKEERRPLHHLVIEMKVLSLMQKSMVSKLVHFISLTFSFI